MSTALVMERVAEASPLQKARIAGAFYLLTILMGLFAFFVSGRLVVSGDAAATAANILAHQSSFRLGFAANFITTACYIAVTGLFYSLFKPVSRDVAFIAALFSFAGCVSGGVGGLASLVVLGGARYLSVFKPEQLEALALMFLKLDVETYNGALVFFGFYCLLIGYLIFRSHFLSRIPGMLMAIAGLCWLTKGFATFLSPPLANYLSSYNLALGLLGEGSLTLWLLAKGVNVERWKEQATLSGR